VTFWSGSSWNQAAYPSQQVLLKTHDTDVAARQQVRLVLARSPVKAGDSSPKAADLTRCRCFSLMCDWDYLWRHPERMKYEIKSYYCVVYLWYNCKNQTSIAVLIGPLWEFQCLFPDGLWQTFFDSGLADLTVRPSALFCSRTSLKFFNMNFLWESSVNLDVDPVIEVGCHFHSLLQRYFFFLLIVAEKKCLAVHAMQLIGVNMKATAKSSLGAVWQWKINRKHRSMHWAYLFCSILFISVIDIEDLGTARVSSGTTKRMYAL